MTFTLFRVAPAVVVVWVEALDPFWRDMDEGDSYWTSEPSVRFVLPRKDIPPIDLSKPKEIARFRYTEEMQRGVKGHRIRKMKYNET